MRKNDKPTVRAARCTVCGTFVYNRAQRCHHCEHQAELENSKTPLERSFVELSEALRRDRYEGDVSALFARFDELVGALLLRERDGER